MAGSHPRCCQLPTLRCRYSLKVKRKTSILREVGARRETSAIRSSKEGITQDCVQYAQLKGPTARILGRKMKTTLRNWPSPFSHARLQLCQTIKGTIYRPSTVLSSSILPLKPLSDMEDPLPHIPRIRNHFLTLLTSCCLQQPRYTSTRHLLQSTTRRH